MAETQPSRSEPFEEPDDFVTHEVRPWIRRNPRAANALTAVLVVLAVVAVARIVGSLVGRSCGGD